MRARLTAVFFIIPLACGAAAAEAASPWGVLRKISGAETLEIEVTSLVVPNLTGSRPETDWIAQKTERVWVAQKREARSGAPAKTQWAESGTCYQLIETLARLTDLDAPPRESAARRAEIRDVSEAGATYVLAGVGVTPAQGRTTDATLTDGGSASARRIVEDALRDLEPCWSDERPSVLNPS